MESKSEYAYIQSASPKEMDLIWSLGWRHFGSFFFKDQEGHSQGKTQQVIPLRIDLKNHFFSKSQKTILKKNAGTKVIFRDLFIDDEKEILFQKHIVRFKENIPDSLSDFLGEEPGFKPCKTLECCLYEKDYLYAVSFLDIGERSTSSVYAMFDPDFSSKSPGLHTLLEEINFSVKEQKDYLYLGYAYQESSFYDYKKKFNALEAYQWNGVWEAFERSV